MNGEFERKNKTVFSFELNLPRGAVLPLESPLISPSLPDMLQKLSRQLSE